MVMHKGIPSVLSKAWLPLSASLRDAVHLQAERTTFLQELVMLIELLASNILRTFFFPTVFPLLIYLFVYFTPITMSVLRDTVFYWSLIHPKDNVIPCLSLPHHSPHFSCSSLYCSPEWRSKDKAVFLSHKQNMDKRRTNSITTILVSPVLRFPSFCL